MNRIDRLTAILIQLQSRTLITAHEIADRFEISLRTVYRDIRALEEAGIPVGAEAGKGYFLVDGYHLPPVMFTQEEASALLLSSKLAEHFTDDSIKEQQQTALDKIRAILRRSDKQHMEHLQEKIKVLNTYCKQTPETNNRNLIQIQKALVEKKVLDIEYHSGSKYESTKRAVEPIGLCYYAAQWHLIAWCRLRSDYRDFRVDKIRQLTLNETSFEKQKQLSLEQYLDQLGENNNLEQVIVSFHKSVLPYIQQQKIYQGFVSEKEQDDRIEMTFLTPSIYSFGRWLLMYGNTAQIISPDILKTRMHALTQELKEHYQAS